MPFIFFDPTMVLLIPAMILAMWAQYKVKATYAQYQQIATHSGMNGATVAEAILRDENIHLSHEPTQEPAGSACGLEAIPGHLTDHYDPTARTLRLSEEIYYGTSIASLGIAAHEVGHAIQHSRLYSPLVVRGIIYPVCGLASNLAFPLFLAGFFVYQPLMQVAIVMFTLAMIFTVVTLPVEFNASSRAIRALSNGGYLTDDELAGARKVLNAAALTYVASAAMAISQLVRMLILADRD